MYHKTLISNGPPAYSLTCYHKKNTAMIPKHDRALSVLYRFSDSTICILQIIIKYIDRIIIQFVEHI